MRSFALSALAVLAVGPLLSSGPAAAQDPVAQFSSGVQLVEVYATVADEKGEPVMGLRQSDFDVYENGERQEISAFGAGEFPLTCALGIDRSLSMTGEPLRLAKLASQSFLLRLRPDDRALVVAIGSDAQVIAPITMDRAEQRHAISALDPWSTTSLYDAIIATLNRLEPERGRQALVIFPMGQTATAAQRPPKPSTAPGAATRSSTRSPSVRPGRPSWRSWRFSRAAGRSCFVTLASSTRRSRRSPASSGISTSSATYPLTRSTAGSVSGGQSR